MLRMLLRKYGLFNSVVCFTVLSTLLSVGITSLMNRLLGDETDWGWPISVIVPAVVTPIFTLHSFGLLRNLDEAEQRLLTLSSVDELTGVYNRRYFIEYAENEMRRVRRYGGHFAIAILDFDNFKTINDTYGHLAGDLALKMACQVIRDSVRDVDVFARYGGDEFIILLPNTDHVHARECLERILAALKETVVSFGGNDIKLKISIGIGAFRQSVVSFDDILARADKALYRAKKLGGNRVVEAEYTTPRLRSSSS